MNFQGVYTAIITPFGKDGASIDYKAYEQLIERQASAGITGIVPCGTSGESPTLNHTEHIDLIRKTVELVNGRMQVVAGTGSNSTREALELTQAACDAGVDAVMLVNPYYNKPSQDGLYAHFKTIAEASKVPVVLYNIQGRTGVNVNVETFKRLKDIPNIQVVKEASGDLGQMARIIHECGKDLALLSGDDNIIPAVMGVGGSGVISVASNLYPRRMVRMMNAFLKGDFTAGNKEFYTLLDLMGSLFWDTNPVPVKAGAELMGLCNGSLRLPLVELTADKKAAMKKILDQLGADA